MASSHVAKVTAGGVTGRRIASSVYGRCETAAATAAKTVNLINDAGTTETWAAADLFHGLTIYVQFVNTNTVANPTLNVNSSGAKPIYRYGTTVPSTNVTNSWNAGSVLGFTYDTTVNTSGCWIMHDWLNNNSTYANYSFGNGYGTCTTAEATTAKVGTYANYTLATGGIVAIKFTYAVPASSTLNINSKGAKNIYYRGSAITAGKISAGDLVTFIYNGTQYEVLSIDSPPLTNAQIDTIFANAIGTTGGSVDYVVERGTSGIWTYRKWASGIKECWGITANTTVNYNTLIYSSLRLATNISVSLPSGLFSSITYSQANGYDTGSTAWTTLASCYTTTTTVTLAPMGWNSGGDRTQRFYIYVIGT